MTILKYKNLPDKLKNCVLGYGHFNTIHPGHIRYLKHAKSLDNKLVIALIGDPKIAKKNNFRFKQSERAESLELLNITDYIVCLEENELDKLIEELEPSVLVLGKEFETSKDENILKAMNFQIKSNKTILFHAGEVNYASTELLSGSENELLKRRKAKFISALNRQNISREKIIKSIDAWGTSNLIVLGDTIVDQYAACEAIGLSAEAPVLVVKELEKKDYIGGAAIVASHINALGAVDI